MQVEQAAGLGGGERDQVASGLVCYEGRRGVCPGRREYFSTAVRSPFYRLPRLRPRWQAEVPAAGPRGRRGQ